MGLFYYYHTLEVLFHYCLKWIKLSRSGFGRIDTQTSMVVLGILSAFYRLAQETTHRMHEFRSVYIHIQTERVRAGVKNKTKLTPLVS